MAENVEFERVLVTGATGFIAAHVIQQLQQEGYAVRGTVRSLKDEAKTKHLQDLCPDPAHQLELVEADLENEESWKSAVDGCTYVLHIASPFPLSIPADENTVIKPAVEGVTNVLKAVAANGKVKRVVVTSAGLAICGNLANAEYSEKDWPADVDSLTPYPKSKTLAEKAAWDFVENLKEEEKFELAVVNPVGVVGPILGTNECTATEIIKRLLKRNPMMVPKVNLPLVDVRDVAAGHIAAMKCPEAAGQRHILCGGNIWWQEMGAALRAEFKSQGYNVPTMLVPKFCIRMATPFVKDSKMVLAVWNKVSKFDNTRMREVLKVEPRDLKESAIDMAYSLIEAGIVKKSQKYRGPGGAETAAAAAVANGEGAEGGDAPTSNGPTTEGEAKKEEDKQEDKAEEKKEDEAKPAEEAAAAAPAETEDAAETQGKKEEEKEAKPEEPAADEAKKEDEKKEDAPTTEGAGTEEPTLASEESKHEDEEEIPAESQESQEPQETTEDASGDAGKEP